jgi:hypothetical protein
MTMVLYTVLTLNPYLRRVPTQNSRQEVLRLLPFTSLQTRIFFIYDPSQRFL